jgi:hypothetical protein
VRIAIMALAVNMEKGEGISEALLYAIQNK